MYSHSLWIFFKIIIISIILIPTMANTFRVSRVSLIYTLVELVYFKKILAFAIYIKGNNNSYIFFRNLVIVI